MSGPNGSLIISLSSFGINRSAPSAVADRLTNLSVPLPMLPTLDFLSSRFAQFNQTIFDGRLPVPTFRIGYARRSQGSLSYKSVRHFGVKHRVGDFTLTLSRKFDCPEEEWEDTLIHEMIHLHIAANGIVDTSTHGKVFRQMMHDINARCGRHITISKRLSVEEAERETLSAPRFFCVVKLADGRTALTVAAKTCINSLWRDIPRVYKTVSIDWYWSADAYFSRFPVARTPRLYVVKAEDLAPRLAKAVRLTKDGKRID